ncbi:hypothetical protein WJX73_008836 [Symbiochloris irregularis]|uniref:Uncharacterized protein n=1 Tax=Symbiochloris irregularis TaxID=706552 RepID=A0AAW1PV01_9CHLO
MPWLKAVPALASPGRAQPRFWRPEVISVGELPSSRLSLPAASWLVWRNRDITERPLTSAVFWDVENLPPTLAHAPLASQCIKELLRNVHAAPVHGNIVLHAFGKHAPMEALYQTDELAAGVQRHVTGSCKRNAADLMIQKAVFDYVQQHRS